MSSSSGSAPDFSTRIAFGPVTVADFEELVALRIAAMRESLERLGRFDPERARERLRQSFHPEHTAFIVYDGRRVGFYTFRPDEDGLHLDHLYIHPNDQGRGIGSHVLRQLLAQSEARTLPVTVTALRGSASNRFYRRHGFVPGSEEEWDIHYTYEPKVR